MRGWSQTEGNVTRNSVNWPDKDNRHNMERTGEVTKIGFFTETFRR